MLIDLTEFCGQLVEAKCLAVNPRDNNYLAVGANGPFVRLYDIRMINNYRLVGFLNVILWLEMINSNVAKAPFQVLTNMHTKVLLFFFFPVTQKIRRSEHISSCAHIL